jgi:hypothetical protein
MRDRNRVEQPSTSVRRGDVEKAVNAKAPASADVPAGSTSAVYDGRVFPGATDGYVLVDSVAGYMFTPLPHALHTFVGEAHSRTSSGLFTVLSDGNLRVKQAGLYLGMGVGPTFDRRTVMVEAAVGDVLSGQGTWVKVMPL